MMLRILLCTLLVANCNFGNENTVQAKNDGGQHQGGAAKPTASQALALVSSAFNPKLLYDTQKFLMLKHADIEKIFRARIAPFKAAAVEQQQAILKPLILDILVALNDQGKVLEYLTFVRDVLSDVHQAPVALQGERGDAALKTIAVSIDNQLQYQGLSRKTRGLIKPYESWAALADRLHNDLNQKIARAHTNDKIAPLDDPKYWQLIDTESHAQQSSGNEFTIKINGVVSFEKRDEMFAGAKKSIHLLSWSFEDDDTGKRYADVLIKKASEGIDVRVMVDGQTADNKGYRDQLARMQKAGVQVVRWRSNNSLRAFDGQHRKMTIVDGQEMIGGGMNYGDVYSHNRGLSQVKWRDTDVYIKGPGAVDGENLFAGLWNEELARPENAKLTTLEGNRTHAPVTSATVGNLRVINQRPGTDDSIMRTNLLLIKGAQSEINIENAYFIGDAVVEKALEDALARGVHVNILSNSSESIDVPEIANPILASLNRMQIKGAAVYLKKGTDTLHTKSLQVDGKAGWIGSWNMHPRSERIEGEMIYLSRDPAFNQQQQAMFKSDITPEKAIMVTKPIPITTTTAGELFETYGYDLL